MSGWLSPIVAVSLCQFLALHCFKIYLASFSRYKTAFSTQCYAPQFTEEDQIDAKWLGKKLISWRKCGRVGRSLTIMNKSIKETEHLIFFSVRSNLISHINTKTCIFSRGYHLSWKYYIWCSFREKKFDLAWKKSNILYLLFFSVTRIYSLPYLS